MMNFFLRISVFSLLALACSAAQAQWSANIGWQSDYIFRGIPQSNSSAQGGVDFERGGFSAGTWAADVGQGAEVDLYGGYQWTIDDFTVGAGYTGYFYTDDFDDTYHEINLNFGYGAFSLEVTNGRYDNFSGPTQDYSFLAGTFDFGHGVSLTLADFGRDADGAFASLGYEVSVDKIDLLFAWVYSDNDLLGGSSEHNLVFGVSHTFGFGTASSSD